VATPSLTLLRTIGRWSLAALMINSIVGSGIFGLPSSVAGHLGAAAPWAYLVAGGGILLVGLCLAEVASQFQQAGGVYLYTRETLGRFWGIQIAWLTWLSRLAAASGTANLFTTYLAQVVPQATDRWYRAGILTLLILVLAGINYVGVKSGTRFSDFFTVTKLALLVSLVVAGLVWIAVHGRVTSVPLTHAVGSNDWLEAVLALVYAYGGFEAVLFATAEMRDPRKDIPVALLVGIGTVSIIYTLVQVVVNGTLANPASTERPLAEAAGHIFGAGAAALVAMGALISIYGYLSANMLHTPRLTFALAERGDFPPVFRLVHRRFHTPYVSIVLYSALLLAFTLAGSFRWNITLSAVARLFTYSAVALALLVLRRRSPSADSFRAPLGPLTAGLAILFCLVLLMRMPLSNVPVVGLTVLLALLNWMIARRSRPAPSAPVAGQIG
jgi:basic amino acid/polyamine antiporter, APA family